MVRTFPEQAFLLIDRLPADKQLAILREWFSLADLDIALSRIAHLSAMRMAQWPTPIPGFAARILIGSEEQLTFVLQARRAELFGPRTVACGDSMARKPEEGWPVVYVPMVEEGPNSLSGLPLITLDDDRVTYQWMEEDSPGGSCAGLTGLDQTARHRILAHWLGLGKNTMGWQTETSATIVWSNRRNYEVEVGRIVNKQQEAFSFTVEVLVRLGLISIGEASYARPKLTLRMVCSMNPCPIVGLAMGQPPDFQYLSF